MSQQVMAALIAAIPVLIWIVICSGQAGLQKKATAFFTLLLIPLSFFGARIGYMLVDYEYYLSDGAAFFFESLVDFEQEGYLCYGLLAGALLAAWMTSRIFRVKLAKLLDIASAPAAALLCLLTVLEGVFGAGYGWTLEDWFTEGEGYSVFVLEDPSFFQRFPFGVSDYYGEWRWAVFVLLALLLTAICVAIACTKRKGDGARFSLLLLTYASLQLLGESLRQDSIPKWGFVRVNQVLSAVLILGLLIYFEVKTGAGYKEWILSAALILLSFLMVTAMEFAMEGKISAIEWMTMDVCYLFTTLASVLALLVLLKLWKKNDPEKN